MYRNGVKVYTIYSYWYLECEYILFGVIDMLITIEVVTNS